MSTANCERPTSSTPETSTPAAAGSRTVNPVMPGQGGCPALGLASEHTPDMNVAAAAGFQAGAALPADGRGPARESPVPRVSNTLRLIRNTPGLRPPPFPVSRVQAT